MFPGHFLSRRASTIDGTISTVSGQFSIANIWRRFHRRRRFRFDLSDELVRELRSGLDGRLSDPDPQSRILGSCATERVMIGGFPQARLARLTASLRSASLTDNRVLVVSPQTSCARPDAWYLCRGPLGVEAV